MGKTMNSVFRILGGLVFRARQASNKCISEVARDTKNQKVLEIGSGKKINGKYPYSYANLFEKSNQIVMSDVNPEFGHTVVDVTKMSYSEEFDLIICFSVLEHVYDYNVAIENIYNALKKGGKAAIFVPYAYPLHDEPYDFFRFSEHTLKKMFSKFSSVKIKHFGIKQFPTAYFLVAIK